jgi:hypothetical protein
MADPTELREWARANGYDVPERGNVRKEIRDAYDRAHADDGDGGVTAGDFGDADDSDGDVTTASPPPAREPAAPKAPPRERAPRRVRGKVPAVTRPKGWRFWQGAGTGKPKGPRADLSEFAADVWADLAMITAPLPPVSRVLTVQAPYAGVVFDQAVKGIPLVDSLLQPVAKASVSLRALNGLIGPPVMVASICMDGEDGWQHDQAGRLVIDEDGRPQPTQPTALKFGMLRYSLAQMARTADLDKVRERAEQDAERMAAVDSLIDFIFGFPPRQAPAPDDASHRSPASPGQDRPRGGYRYPPAPAMDGAGMPREAAEA